MIGIMIFLSIMAIDQSAIYNECRENGFDFDIPYQVSCPLEVDSEHPLFDDCVAQNFEGSITQFHICSDYED